jgi:hypothetical protein
MIATLFVECQRSYCNKCCTNAHVFLCTRTAIFKQLQHLQLVPLLLNLYIALPLQSELGKGQQPPILSCDVALLVFNPDETTSVQYAIDTSNALPYSMPRLFICAPQSNDNNINSSNSNSSDDVIDQFVPLEDSNEQSEGYNTILEYCKVSALNTP